MVQGVSIDCCMSSLLKCILGGGGGDGDGGIHEPINRRTKTCDERTSIHDVASALCFCRLSSFSIQKFKFFYTLSFFFSPGFLQLISMYTFFYSSSVNGAVQQTVQCCN